MTQDATETFESPQAFLNEVSPEALNQFHRIECLLKEDEAEVIWHLNRPEGSILRIGPARAGLVVNGRSVSDNQLRAMINAVNRGYRPYWGSCSWPDAVLARSTYQRYGHAIRNGLRVLIGATVGLSLALAAQRIAGADPPVVAFLVAVLLGGLVPIAVDALLPDVDVALLGRTRIVVVARRLAASAGSALGAQVLAFLAGK